MSCTCKQDIEAALLERFKAEHPAATDHAVELQGYGFAIRGNVTLSIPFAPYKVSALHPLKNGGAKLKSKLGFMHFSHCPYCGTKIEASKP